MPLTCVLAYDRCKEEDRMLAEFNLMKRAQWIGVTTLFISLAGTAHADRQSPAPITFSDQTQTRSQATALRAHAELSGATPHYAQTGIKAAQPELARMPLQANARTRRLDFRYPDPMTPDIVGQTALKAAPLAISTASTAASVAQNAPLSLIRDPIGLAGGLETSVAGAKVALGQAAKVSRPIRIAALKPEIESQMQSPLTFSQVTPLGDTQISEESGAASVYGEGFEGHPTANGEPYDPYALTAAHRTLPLPSLVHVTHAASQKEIVVRVNDRGPFGGDAILELTPRAGEMLGLDSDQMATVSLRYLGPAPVKSAEQFASHKVEEDILPALKTEAATSSQPRMAASPLPVASQDRADTMEAGIYVQAGAFSEISNAQRMVQRLKPFHPVRLEQARVNGSDYFRVFVGPFDSRGEADFQRQQLAYDGLTDGFVTRR